MKLNIENSWKNLLNNEFEKEYFSGLMDFLMNEYDNHIIYPPKKIIFNAFNNCSFKDIKVVIIGQDPYHGPNQAHGLSFSVADNIKLPPSLRNIFKELHNDLSVEISSSGNLTHWAQQGVFLLNSILTVRKGAPGSHKMKGWEKFTNTVIDLISKRKNNIVFLLWGLYAQKKGLYIDRNKHLVIESTHPSPFSAYKNFFG